MQSSGKYTTISQNEARRMLAGGAILLDVRTPEEYRAAHLPGSTSLPLNRLPCRIKSVAAPEKTLLLYCSSGARSRTAAQILRQMGYRHIYIVAS
jgi:rhodanese-related sulfurtransferase